MQRTSGAGSFRNGSGTGSSGFMNTLRSNAINAILLLLIAYYGVSLLLEIGKSSKAKGGASRISTGEPTAKDLDTKVVTASDESSGKPPGCKKSVYDWEREDWRHQKVLDDRKAYYREVSIGTHNKMLGGVSSSLQSLILHGFQPSMSCADLQRYGGVQDGGKVLCEATRLLNTKEECIVYSFGVGFDCKFEVSLLEAFPDCTVHMFDPSVSMSKFVDSHCSVGGANFYPWGVKGEKLLPSGDVPPPSMRPTTAAGSEQQSAPTLPPLSRFKSGYYSLPRIMQHLGHTGRKIQMIKMDIEGGEFDSLMYLMAPQNKHIMFNTNLISLEVHEAPPGYQERLISELEARHMRLYYVERNPYYPSVLAEVAMVNSTALRLLDGS
eukprot:scpid49774/ scgid6525/ 